MYKILMLILSFVILNANSPFIENTNNVGDNEVFLEDEINNTSINNINQASTNLNAIQKSFWTDKDNINNIQTINFRLTDNKTYKIRTRSAMVSNIVFKDDEIAQMVTADDKAYSIEQIKNQKYNINNMIAIKPLLIGVDTSLMIIGTSGNIYNFYIFSTDHTNSRNPHLLTFIRNDDIEHIDKVNIVDLEAKRLAELKEEKEREKKKSGEFLLIGDNTNHITIDLSKIERGYTQKPRENIFGFVSDEAKAIMASDIFNDEKYTYFKYDRRRADSKFPAVYRVVDEYDNPVNVKIVGDYIIAETISSKYTLRIGKEYVCVRKKYE